ncbi:hypothetical protein ACF3NT_09870 [Naumannella halotolerans]|uniref:Uncharacterized protein n=1 Tax=Naumannella halotolerans TaxID=993414 RepID=A0A4R7J9W7_9ACTN|nr:hypothetical protein [Naumannella halotolerans]TDT34340.1 hypothetical protein CLV29_1999 [Naumannella halotolerans]
MNGVDQAAAPRRAAPPRASTSLIVGTVAAFVSCAGLGTGVLGYLTGNLAMGIAATVALIGAIGTVILLSLSLDSKTPPTPLWLRICGGVAIVAGGAAFAAFLALSVFEIFTPVALGISIVAQLLIMVASFTHYD